jgi:hypothetical protein
MGNNIEVKFQEHYKLYILFKDYIIFEQLLIEKSIDYYYNLNENTNISNGIRFFILGKDKFVIDYLLIENQIIASTETILISDYRDEEKTQKFQIFTYLMVLLLIIFIVIVGDFI